MAMRCAIARVIRRPTSSSSAALASAQRWLSGGQGKILSEEEMAKENVYIKVRFPRPRRNHIVVLRCLIFSNPCVSVLSSISTSDL